MDKIFVERWWSGQWLLNTATSSNFYIHSQLFYSNAYTRKILQFNVRYIHMLSFWDGRRMLIQTSYGEPGCSDPRYVKHMLHCFVMWYSVPSQNVFLSELNVTIVSYRDIFWFRVNTNWNLGLKQQSRIFIYNIANI